MKVVMVKRYSKVEVKLWRLACSCHYKSQNPGAPVSSRSGEIQRNSSLPEMYKENKF